MGPYPQITVSRIWDISVADETVCWHCQLAAQRILLVACYEDGRLVIKQEEIEWGILIPGDRRAMEVVRKLEIAYIHLSNLGWITHRITKIGKCLYWI